jgi:hypothetical protein
MSPSFSTLIPSARTRDGSSKVLSFFKDQHHLCPKHVRPIRTTGTVVTSEDQPLQFCYNAVLHVSTVGYSPVRKRDNFLLYDCTTTYSDFQRFCKKKKKKN